MPKNKLRVVLIAVLLLTAHRSFAHGAGNGGDITCDGHVKDITSNLQNWLRGGGPEHRKLDLSSSTIPKTQRPYTLKLYETRMLALLASPLDVSCVSPAEPGYPVMVGKSVKVCANYVDRSGIHMTCDRKIFMGMSGTKQIEQIHHEFATDVPGLEPDNGPFSTYKISLQLSDSIRYQLEAKLMIDPPGFDQLEPFSKLFDRAQPLKLNGMAGDTLILWTHNDASSASVGLGWVMIYLNNTTTIPVFSVIWTGAPSTGLYKPLPDETRNSYETNFDENLAPIMTDSDGNVQSTVPYADGYGRFELRELGSLLILRAEIHGNKNDRIEFAYADMIKDQLHFDH